MPTDNTPLLGSALSLERKPWVGYYVRKQTVPYVKLVIPVFQLGSPSNSIIIAFLEVAIFRCGEMYLSCRDVLPGQVLFIFPLWPFYLTRMCKTSRATSQAKICACKIWWLSASHEFSGSLKRQANKSQCLFMLVHVCTMYVRVLKMLTLSRENSVFGVKTCSLFYFALH